MLENFKSDQLSTQQSESIAGGRGGRGRRRGYRMGLGKGRTFETIEAKEAFMEKREKFKAAFTELRGGESWSTLTHMEKKMQKRALRESIFGSLSSKKG